MRLAPTSTMATSANRYASQVPLPAVAKTSGITNAGVALGAIFAIACPSTSVEERHCERRPEALLAGWVCGRVKVSVTNGISSFKNRVQNAYNIGAEWLMDLQFPVSAHITAKYLD